MNTENAVIRSLENAMKPIIDDVSKWPGGSLPYLGRRNESASSSRSDLTTS